MNNLKSTKDLLAELDAEFGKKSKAAKVKKVAGTVTYERNSTGGISDLMHESNVIAKGFANKPGWEPCERVTYIIHETCRECDGVVSYIGNEFTRFRNERLRSYVLSPELLLEDSLGFELPFGTDEWSHKVDRCARCLRIDQLALRIGEELDKPRTMMLNFA